MYLQRERERGVDCVRRGGERREGGQLWRLNPDDMFSVSS
jgi:hypothetical protein